MGAQIGIGDRRRAELKVARRPVPDDRYRVETGKAAVRQDMRDLVETVAARIEHERLLARLQPAQQIADVGRPRVDKHQLPGAGRHSTSPVKYSAKSRMFFG